jgi:plastocyanin
MLALAAALLLSIAACGRTAKADDAKDAARRARTTTTTRPATTTTTTESAPTSTTSPPPSSAPPTVPPTTVAPTTVAPAPQPGAAAVSIKGYAFNPGTLRVAAGSRVTFTNGDGEYHTATTASGPSRFDSGSIDPTKPGGYSVTLTARGTYAYFCAIHPNMTGTIVVT